MMFAHAITATRLSLLFFYHRVFPMKRFTTVVRVTGCIVLGWWISFLITVIFSCYPVHGFWDRSVKAKCYNQRTFAWGVTGTEVFTNVLMLVIPIPWLLDLYLPRAKKLALFGIFMLGSL